MVEKQNMFIIKTEKRKHKKENIINLMQFDELMNNNNLDIFNNIN